MQTWRYYCCNLDLFPRDSVTHIYVSNDFIYLLPHSRQKPKRAVRCETGSSHFDWWPSGGARGPQRRLSSLEKNRESDIGEIG